MRTGGPESARRSVSSTRKVPLTSRATLPGAPHTSRPPGTSSPDASRPGWQDGQGASRQPDRPGLEDVAGPNRFLQGYNAQAAVSTDQVIVAAEVTNAANDSTMFVPMVRATEKNLVSSEANGVGTFVADTGYWSVENVYTRHAF